MRSLSLHFIYPIFVFLQLNAEKSPFQRTYANQVFNEIVNNPLNSRIVYSIVLYSIVLSSFSYFSSPFSHIIVIKIWLIIFWDYQPLLKDWGRRIRLFIIFVGKRKKSSL